MPMEPMTERFWHYSIDDGRRYRVLDETPPDEYKLNGWEYRTHLHDLPPLFQEYFGGMIPADVWVVWEPMAVASFVLEHGEILKQGDETGVFLVKWQGYTFGVADYEHGLQLTPAETTVDENPLAMWDIDWLVCAQVEGMEKVWKEGIAWNQAKLKAGNYEYKY